MRRVRALAMIAALLARPAFAADLSPAHWPAEDRARLHQAEMGSFPIHAREIAGKSGLVAGTASSVAVHAGAQALAQGGTAADAAATVALTQIVRNLGATTSYAGKLELIYFEARTGKVVALDGGWGSYAGETDPASIPAPDLSYLSGVFPAAGVTAGVLGRQTLVPGFMAGIEAMHARFGRLPFADLFQPAIWYAENGMSLSAGRAGFLRQLQPLAARTEAGRRSPAGALPKPGDLFRQPELATTLKGVAAHGAAYMYSGPWARAYVEAVRAEGGKATLADLSRYRPVWRPTMRTRFAGADVVAMSVGNLPCAELGALNLMSAAGVERMGPYWRDPAAFKAYARAIRFATSRTFAKQATGIERARGFGGADCESRLAPGYGAAIAPEILRGAQVFPDPDVTTARHTMAAVVVDRWGNVAVLVHSSNGFATGIVVGGVPIPSAGAINKAYLAKTRPGDHVVNDIAPLIALRDGKPVLAIGAVGTSLAPETVRVAGEVLSSHADLRTAMAAPPLLMDLALPGPGETFWSMPYAVPAGAYGPEMLKALAAESVRVREEPPMRVLGDLRGSAIAVVIDRPSGAAHAVELTTLDGYAEATPP